MPLDETSIAKPRAYLALAAACLAAFLHWPAASNAAQVDPLPSWQDRAARQAIVRFVENATREDSPGFIPVSERIAVFDNDGTLWAEQPMYFQLLFAIDRVKQLSASHPEWKDQEPYVSILAGDLKHALAGGEKAIVELVMATHAGMTSTEFDAIVLDWIGKARHPKTGKLLTEMVYQPMLELLAYLREKRFKTFIASGGGIDFIRPWAERVYGIPPEQVIGSRIRTRFELRNGDPALVRLPEVDTINDKEGKPVGIQSHVGRRPVVAIGNSDGDRQMLQWTHAGAGPRLALLVRHDDPAREFAYGAESSIGRFSDSLAAEAREKGWIVVSMREDWKRVFPFER